MVSGTLAVVSGRAVRVAMGAMSVVLAGVAVGGCVKEYQPSAAELASTTTAPAPESGVVGAVVTHGGVKVVVVDITSFDRTPDAIPRVRAVLRSENLGDRDAANPVVSLRCDESAAGGEWFRGSSWESGQLLPAGTVSEGESLVGFPAKPDAPLYSVASCTNARLRLEIGGANESVQVIDYAVSPEVITESIQRPRGRKLPLPMKTA